MANSVHEAAAARKPLKVFISYSHEDDAYREKLKDALVQLKRDGLIASWDDREITAGREWAGNIDEHLETADIVIFLVSRDSLASDYCYDIEMKRALERHAKGEARVIPVILRPSDWKHSPFSKLQALPKGGKPVVDWKSEDHAFEDIANGLRAVAEELMRAAATPAGSGLLVKPRAGRKRWPLATAGIAALILLAAFWLWYTKLQGYLAQGDAFLNVGRYAQAREPYEHALRLNALSSRAKAGLAAVELAALLRDPVTFEQRLKQALQQWPNDSHLLVLNGDYLYGQNRLDDALVEYQAAAKRNPELAEAYFRMGVIYDRKGQIGHSIDSYNEAFKLSSYSPQYATNLADEYVKHGDYGAAVTLFSPAQARYPLAALESAKIHRRLGELDEARELDITALSLLQNSSRSASPEEQLPWSFTEDTRGVEIVEYPAKLCYAQLELSATQYLSADEKQASDNAAKAAQTCPSELSYVKSAVAWELERVADEQDELKPRATAYLEKFLRQ